MKKTVFITQAAIIAALYVVLTLLANALGLASNAIQVRFSEALTILPIFTPAAIPGLFIGCIISNLLCGAILWDVIFGSIATLLGAVGTYYIGKFFREKSMNLTCILAPIPPIVSNTVIVPLILVYAYHLPDALWFLAATVGAGEVISCGILGIILFKVLQKNSRYIFRNE